MWLIIICVVIGFVWTWAASGFFVEEGIGGAIMGLLTGVVVALLLGAAISDKETLTPERHNLVNIADNTELHGSFFLFSGSIDEVPVYGWYEKTGPNTYKRRSVNSDYAEIHYLSGDKQPYYEISRFKYESGLIKDWYLNVSSGKAYTGEDYDFYVPRGTITTQFKLDAK